MNEVQFDKDIPRLNLLINGEKCNEEPVNIRNFLMDKFKTDFPIYIMTQTFLSDFYIEKAKTLNSNEFLINGKRYDISLDLFDNTITITKDFDITYIDESDDYQIENCILVVVIDIKTKQVVYSWETEF